MKGTGATSATRGTGRSEGVVGVSPTGIELGLKVGGIGQLGISTDYGGGIVIGIFGQKIVWGREGGKIHYNFGGLEVIVEARDCVVVETRKIFGQVTGRHVYPDPGCKLPPEPGPTPEPTPIPEPGLPPPMPDPEPGNQYLPLPFPARSTPKLLPESNVRCYYAINYLSIDYDFRYYYKGEVVPHVGYFCTFVKTTGFVNANEKVSGTSIRTERNQWSNYPIGNSVRPYEQYEINPQIVYATATQINNTYLSSNSGSQYYYTTEWQGTDENPGYHWYVKVFSIRRASVEEIWCPGGSPPQPSTLPILPPAGNQPPMPESCCEALAADIEDIKEVLACKEILAGKMTFPWKWRMPGGQGEEILLDYPSLARAIAQQIDHLGIHPPKLTVKDINNAVAGDQSLSNQFPSVTQAFEALMAQVWDANADVDTLTNFLYRLAWLNVQQSFNMAQLTGSVEALKDMIGGETESLETELTTPFNIAAGTSTKKMPPGKGFGKSANQPAPIDNRIEANTEMSTEAMLPEFLKIRENPILVDSFTGKQDIFDILLLIRADLEKLKNK